MKVIIHVDRQTVADILAYEYSGMENDQRPEHMTREEMEKAVVEHFRHTSQAAREDNEDETPDLWAERIVKESGIRNGYQRKAFA